MQRDTANVIDGAKQARRSALESETSAHVVFTWRVHPMREQPARAVMGVIWMFAAAVVIYATTLSMFWMFFAVVFLLGALNRFFLPSRFTIDDEGITAEYPMRTQRMKWEDVQRFAHDEHGGVLSDRAQRSRLDALRGRGVQLMFGKSHDEAVRAIKQRLPTTQSRKRRA